MFSIGHHSKTVAIVSDVEHYCAQNLTKIIHFGELAAFEMMQLHIKQ
jgi:hypothetical protein